MPVARASRRIASVTVAMLILAISWSAISAQDAGVHRFFGFLGDITVDGEPVGPGSTIAAKVDGVIADIAVVNAAGAWILDLDSDLFEDGNCNITFVVNELEADTPWETCTMRVRLALVSPGGQTGAEPDSEESDSLTDAGSGDSDSDSVEGGSEAEQAGGDEDGKQPMAQAGEIVRPEPPSTGTGGVLEANGGTDWVRAVAVTAMLTLLAAAAALLISRRSDGTT